VLNDTSVPKHASPNSGNTEIELKLAADAKDFARIRRTSFWSGPVRAQTRVLDSIYFDTVGHDLRARGFSLRLRKVGQRFRQTFKASGAGGYFERREFEIDLRENKPDLSAVDDPSIRLQLADIDAAELKPIFTTHVRRSRKLYQPEVGTAVEISLDDGEVRDGKGTAPLSEIELELKQGPPETLFNVARELRGIIPLRLQVQSKPEIGYTLCEGKLADWTTAGRLELRQDMTTEVALDAIIEYCVSHILRNDKCAAERAHIEGVHQVRVGLRRLRSGLRLFRSVLPRDQYDWIAGEARMFANALGPTRDLDVFRSSILPPVARRFADAADFAGLDGTAARLQDQDYELVRETMSSERFTIFMIELMRWRKMRSWRNQTVTAEAAHLFSPIGDLSTPLLIKRHKAVVKKGRGFADLSVDARHEVRLLVKKLRYATDFFEGLYPSKSGKRYIRHLRRLQDDLGHLNDVVTLNAILDRILENSGGAKAQRAAGFLIGWYEREVASGEGRLIDNWERFEKAKPFWR
jgi:triphosphatase